MQMTDIIMYWTAIWEATLSKRSAAVSKWMVNQEGYLMTNHKSDHAMLTYLVATVEVMRCRLARYVVRSVIVSDLGSGRATMMPM